MVELVDWNEEDFNAVSLEEWRAIYEENQEAIKDLEEEELPEVTELAASTDTAKTADAAKTADKAKTTDTAKTTDAKAAEGGSGAVWWIVGVLAVAGLGGGFWYYKKGQDNKEGGNQDMYCKFIDQETTI